MNLCELCPSYDNDKEEVELSVLKCGHRFCWICLKGYMRENLNYKMKCPSSTCSKYLPDSIIRKILSAEDIKKYELFSLSNIERTHHCLLPQCPLTIQYTDSNLQYQCYGCSLYNCVSCMSSHPFYDCQKYQVLTIKQKNQINEDEKSRALKIFRKDEKEKMRAILLEEDDMDILNNNNVFTCNTCNMCQSKGTGIKLRHCQHLFCRECLVNYIKQFIQIPVKCPQDKCDNTISDREVQGLLDLESLKIYISNSNNNLKGKLVNYLQCKQPDCDSIYHYTIKPPSFTCYRCKKVNCVTCCAIHTEENCRKMNNKETEFIESQIKEKKLMRCLSCKVLLSKVSGCNWISCTNCGTELCWITQNYRWGSKGRGDTSAGCRCDVFKPCHPDCTSGCTPHVSMIPNNIPRLRLDNTSSNDSLCVVM